jgi:crotonobetaine/carnitine-CoA ligase
VSQNSLASSAERVGGLPVHDVPDLVTALQRAAARWPNRAAWTFPLGERLTFGEVADQSTALAAGLAARGVEAGDRIGVMLSNTAAFPLVWFALARLGAAMVPLNPRYRSADLDHLLRTARCRAVVSRPQDWESLGALTAESADSPPVWDVTALAAGAPSSEPLRDINPDDCLNIQFTSGTTGRPKGCILTHHYWITLGRSLITEFPRLGEEDVMLTAQPFYYVDPQWNVVAALLAGAHLIVLDGFHPSTFWDEVRAHHVTYFYCLAAMPTLLLTTPVADSDTDHQVRVIQCSAIPPARHRELERRWGVPWFEAFGMTETGADLRVDETDHDLLVGSGCVGAPASHRQVRIVGADGHPTTPGSSGELQLRGPGMMSGYFDDPRATAAAFDGEWFRTGDLAHLDDAGRVYLDGRIKDMIRRSGENIAAREVEDVLMTHPDVQLAAVLAVPDDVRGEEVKAVIVATPGHEPAAASLAAYAGERLAAFKVPRFWEFRTSLPLTASHRVAKASLGAPVGPVHDVRPGRPA